MYNYVKRILDVVISLVVIVVLSPLFLILSIWIKIDSKGPAIYKGERSAMGGGVFFIYKFRTMIANADKLGGPSTALNDLRLTRFGRFLRRYKFDELPQFFNVLFGDMSLVGPRPQVKYYTDEYEGELKLILDVKPGITDYASIYFTDMDRVLGTVDVDKVYKEEVEPIKNLLRLRYVKEKSMFVDIKIILLTIRTLVGGKVDVGVIKNHAIQENR